MRIGRSALAFVVLASTGGCIYQSNYPNVGNWDAVAVEQPQRVRFFYGYVIDERTVPVIYNSRIQNWEPQGRRLVPVTQQYPAPTPETRPPGYEDPCPDRVCSGVEYTVMLDKSTVPPDEFLRFDQHPAVIVVQNIAATHSAMPKGTRVVVRMVNNTAAEVMDARVLPPMVDGINVHDALSAGPMPVPLSYRPPPPLHVVSSGWIAWTQGSGAEGSTYYPSRGMSRY